MDGRLFGLDVQLVFDALVMFIFIMVLYLIMSKLFFKPVRAFIEKRQESIDEKYAGAEDDRKKALELKAAYEEKMKDVNKEAELFLAASRKNALKRQEEIIEAARIRAGEILAAARKEVASEKLLATDKIKEQSAAIAVLMASEFVSVKHPEDAGAYVDDVYRETGGGE